MIDWPLLLAALIAVESGGDVNAIGDNGKAVGCLQIHPVMVAECNRILHRKFGNDEGGFRFTEKDRHFESLSRNMAVTYLRYWGDRYKRQHGKAPTYEVYARMWNGGPTGYRKETTEWYWRKVLRTMERLRREQAAETAAGGAG